MIVRTLITLTLLVFFITGNLPADEKTARSLILAQGCKGCHRFEGDGGSLAPPLDRIGERLNYEQLHRKLLYPQKSAPGSVMPSFRHLTEEELRALALFLADQGNQE